MPTSDPGTGEADVIAQLARLEEERRALDDEIYSVKGIVEGFKEMRREE